MGQEYSYVIGALTTKYVKIGKTANPIEKRMAALQTASPYKLVLLGTSDVPEVKLHYRFRKYRIGNGEWFLWNDDLKYFISHECRPGKAWSI
jgi:predicted PolB exonuclease-like 3'-5' exonuclease